MKTLSDKTVKRKSKHILYLKISFENRGFKRIMCKNVEWPGRPQMAI
jgi:hypothetical protein